MGPASDESARPSGLGVGAGLGPRYSGWGHSIEFLDVPSSFGMERKGQNVSTGSPLKRRLALKHPSVRVPRSARPWIFVVNGCVQGLAFPQVTSSRAYRAPGFWKRPHAGLPAWIVGRSGTSASSALVTVVRAQSYLAINSCSNGIRWLRRYSSERMRSSMCIRMRRYNGSRFGSSCDGRLRPLDTESAG
jgi:hypothetical protein